MYFERDLVEVEFDIRLLFRHDVTSANSSHSPEVELDPFNTRQRPVEERFCIGHASVFRGAEELPFGTEAIGG
jgi:hypothetical protein